jgi:hypothetical protein
MHNNLLIPAAVILASAPDLKEDGLVVLRERAMGSRRCRSEDVVK